MKNASFRNFLKSPTEHPCSSLFLVMIHLLTCSFTNNWSQLVLQEVSKFQECFFLQSIRERVHLKQSIQELARQNLRNTAFTKFATIWSVKTDHIIEILRFYPTSFTWSILEYYVSFVTYCFCYPPEEESFADLRRSCKI